MVGMEANMIEPSEEGVMELNGPEAKAAFMEKVRRRLTFGMDPGAGSHTHATAFAWAWGYEQALADLDATTAVFEKAFTPSANQRRLNWYSCNCGNTILSEDVDEGVTPFMMPCGACGGDMTSAFYPKMVFGENQQAAADIEWFMPPKEEWKKLTKPTQQHVEQGGLVYRVVADRPALHHLRVLQARQYR